MSSSSQQSFAPRVFALASFCALASFPAAVSAQGSALRELRIDASSESPSSAVSWSLEGVTTLPGPWGGLDLVLDSAVAPAQGTDLYLSFDGGAVTDGMGRWSVRPEGSFRTSDQRDARHGEAAGVFKAPGSKLILTPQTSETFKAGQPGGDFSIEFWLRPSRAENGEILYLWKASQKSGSTWLSQQMSALVLRNRLTFAFLNFFADPSGKETAFNLQASSVIVPGRWSHHLVRFDSSTGLLEYLMDGKPEAVTHATSTGKQGGTVFLPRAGSAGRLELGSNYSGFLDEFSIRSTWVEKAALSRYAPDGGKVRSPVFDLGASNSRLERIDVDSALPEGSAIHWSYRCADSSASWTEEAPRWEAFIPGGRIVGADGTGVRGRYIQLRAEIYPDAGAEKGPRVSGMTVSFEPDLPPSPPTRILATAGDGSIRIDWTPVLEADVRGFVLYYGNVSGEYFGTGARQGPSPVWIPGRDSTSFTLQGLRNGTLYFIAIAAYDDASPPHVGEFSAEVSARPSKVSP